MLNLKALLMSAAIPAIALLHGGLEPDRTLSQAVKMAQNEQRQLMLYFTSTACELCDETDTYFEREDVQKALNENFITAVVDISDFDGKACGEIYHIDAVPAMVIVEPNGEIRMSKSGNLSSADIQGIVTTGEIPVVNKPVAEMPSETVHTPDNTAPVGLFSIQVGFFSSEKNARILSEKIEAQGFDRPSIAEEIRDGKVYYRVLVGHYDTEEVAESNMSQLKKSGYSTTVHRDSE